MRLPRKEHSATTSILISNAIQSHQGQVMHYAGDAVFARFYAVVESVASATGFQKLRADRNEDLADEHKLRFQIGQ